MPALPSKPAVYVGPVLLFDGECALCRTLTGLLLRWDRSGALRLAALQGPAAQAYLRRHGLPTRDFDTLIWVPCWGETDDGRRLVRTDGVVAALRALGSRPARMAAWLLALWPRPLRDAAYRAVARGRTVLGGGRGRDWPPAAWRGRFLD